MKNKLCKIAALCAVSFLGAVLYSCQEDESLPRGGKPVVTVVTPTVTVVEGEDAVFSLNVSQPINDAIQFRIQVVGGDAVEDEDFSMSNFQVPSIYEGEFGYIGVIPAYQSQASFSIKTILDDLPEQTKNVKFKITSVLRGKAFISETTFVDVNIQNFVGTDLVATFEWSGDYIPGVDVCDTGSGLDFDLELYGAGPAPILTSYNDCPEQIVLAGTEADGTYTLDASLWQANGNNTTSGFAPVKITFTKPGVFAQTVDLSAKFPLVDGGLNEGNGNAITTFTITKVGTTYTVVDDTNAQVVQGRKAKKLGRSSKK